MGGQNSNDSKLKPYLSPLGAWAFAIGISLGWGLVFVTSRTYLAQAGPVGSGIGLLIGSLIMLIIGRNYHYMMNSIPDAGGAYAFARETFGYDHGFLTAWFLVLTYLAMFWANVISLPLFSDLFLGAALHYGFHYRIFGYEVYLGEILASVAVILLITILCTRLKKTIEILMIAFAVLITAGIAVLFAGGLFGGGDVTDGIKPYFVPDQNVSLQILRIVCISPWAFIGFENISHSSGEFKFPLKKSFGIMFAAIAASLLAYVCVILLSVFTHPEGYADWVEYIADLDRLTADEALPVFYAVKALLGRGGSILLWLVLAALIVTSLIGNLIPLSRLLYAMAKDGILPQGFAKLNKRGIPANAMWLVAAFSLLIPFLGRSAVGWVVDVTTLGATIIFGFVSASAWKMARSRGDKTERITGMTGVVLMIVFALYLFIFNLISSDSLEAESYFLFTVWTILGFLFFLIVMRKDYTRKFGRTTVVWVALLLLVLFTSLVWMSQSSIHSTRKAMETVREHYDSTATEDVEDIDFMQMEMRTVRLANVQSILVVVILFAVSLAIQMLLQRKHEVLEREKMRAEEGSRAKSRFLFNMSHDIRTPMNAIIGFTNLAKQPGVTAEKKDEYLNKIEDSGQQLLGIINDVLDMSRIENGKMDVIPVEMNLKECAEEAKDLFLNQMQEKGIRFTVDSSGITDEWVMCDKNRFNRILLNLLSNACKFTPAGGEVSLKIAQRTFAVEQVTKAVKDVFTGGEEGVGHYEITVSDTGIGMSEEFAEHLFTPFERERTSTVSGIQGTGLGLSITKGIVERMEGTIDVDSVPGKGSTFIVRLSFPILEEHTDRVEDKEEAYDFTGYRLLLVEDNAINLEIASAILERAGFAVESADDGEAAVGLVERTDAGYYDAVLMDIQMPVMNGYEATKAIRSMEDPGKASVPIIAMTANVFQEDVQAAAKAGMNAHIAKPLDVDIMFRTLRDILSGKKEENAGEEKK